MPDRFPSREAQRARAHARKTSLRHADTTPGNVVVDTVDGVRGYSVGAEISHYVREESAPRTSGLPLTTIAVMRNATTLDVEHDCR